MYILEKKSVDAFTLRFYTKNGLFAGVRNKIRVICNKALGKFYALMRVIQY